MAELPDVTDASFSEEVIASSVPVLVDFWGDHCPACRQLSPVLQQLATSYGDRLRIRKIHAAENPRVTARYGVRAMPTVLLFSKGEVVAQWVGARPKTAFVDAIERAL